jgi:hypothetical protein
MKTNTKAKRFKYPRTPHLPWSPGLTGDDVKTRTVDGFIGRHVVITEKMDGENTTLYRDHCHARSVDSRHHYSRDWVKRLHAHIAHEIPVGWRVCGENLYAQHSVAYKALSSYFYAFSIWNDKNICLSWSESLDWFSLLGLSSPPVLYNGLWDEKVVRSIEVDRSTSEGYVVRLADEYHFDEFSASIAKWVRPGHVQTDTHWMHSAIKPNELLTGNSLENNLSEQVIEEDNVVTASKKNTIND